MLALILHILFSSAFILLIKWAQVRGNNDEVTFGSINYIVAALAILPFFLLSRPDELAPQAIWTGAALGLIYFLTYFLVVFAIRKIGAASTTVVGVMSILVPIAFAAFYYLEIPSHRQMAGIGLALVSLTLIGLQSGKGSSNDGEGPSRDPQSVRAARPRATSTPESMESPTDLWVPAILFLFFILCGLSRIAQEAFKHVVALEQQSAQRATFCLATFIAAGTPAFFVLLFRRKRISSSELGFGFAIGVSNILQTLFILVALQQFAGFLVFPVTSAGGVVLIALVATLLLDEKLTPATVAGIAISVVAVFLLQ